MRTRRLAVTTVAAIVALVGCEDATRPVSEEAPASQRQARVIPNHYIVVFTDAVSDPPGAARGLAVAHGLGLRHTYSRALKGFAAVVPPGRVDALRADPRVRYVTPDRVDRIHQQGVLPTGVDRIEADLNPSIAPGDSVDADIAILDTGIDTDHPDLYVYRVVSFAGGNPEDGFGHGTHVAGTAAALDDGAGVVGVAPGARIWSVKVCKNSGSCSLSDIIAGVDYVAQHHDEIDVANMSLGGRGSDDANCGLDNDDPEHQAICAAVDSGVVFVVSAGNNSADAARYVPASYDEVITVSALADFDGKPGGAAAPTCRDDEDDSFASFSNYGADVDVMAPGVCIESAWKQGGYNTISGTSMAAPHVTGTVALYIARHGRDANGDESIDAADVDLVRSALVGAGILQLDVCGLFQLDDPDGTPEPIVFANALNVGGDGRCGGAAPPAGLDIAVTGVSAPAIAGPGQLIEVRVTVQNAGATDVTQDIAVALVSNNTTSDTGDDFTIGTQSISGLAAGTSTDLVFSWNTSGASLGDHTITASHGIVDDDGTNDSETAIVTLGATTHVGNLDRSSDPPEKGKWTAWVRITVHDAAEAPLDEAEVFGTWRSPDGEGSCVTGADGRCEVSYSGIPRGSQFQIWFTVDSVVVAGIAYDATANHDPDGNSDGTTIEVLDENLDDYRN